MSKNEFMTWFAQQVEPRWSKWQVNTCILNDWYVALACFDGDVLTHAVQQHAIQDDPARPRLHRVLTLARERRAVFGRRDCPQEYPSDAVSGTRFWEIVRTKYDRQQRTGLMGHLMKFCPTARERDPEAYDWITQEHEVPQPPDAEPAASSAPGR
jgi:hypothetical protein